MDDKLIMSTILADIKGECDLMLHGSIESSDSSVLSKFRQGLNDSLNIQSELYSKMASKGWYPSSVADPQKINEAKTRFASC